MSISSHWKTRAIERAQNPKTEVETVRLSAFRIKSFDEIKQTIIDNMRLMMPQAGPALDDPHSNISALVNAIAKSDADLFEQAKILVDTMMGKSLK